MPDTTFIGQLGAGFFGSVWLVHDEAAGERRAMKIIGKSHVVDPANFYAEAQALHHLRHQNIVTVHDAGSLDDTNAYILMEYLPNGSVEAKIEQCVLTARDAKRLGVDACWGLEYAHARGYVHRDVKPANILIGNNEEGKLSDFGLATRVSPSGAASPIGYTSHMAPEVLNGGPCTAQSDVYALGVTIYRMVNRLTSAQFHHVSGDLEELIRRGRFPNRRSYAEWVPESLRRIITKAMHPDPTRRFQSVSDLRHALEQQNVFFDWAPEVAPGAMRWIGIGDAWEVEVSVLQVRKGWLMEYKRGRRGQIRRRQTTHCVLFPTEEDARGNAIRLIRRLTAEG